MGMRSRVFQHVTQFPLFARGRKPGEQLRFSQPVGFRWYLWKGLWGALLGIGVCGFVLYAVRATSGPTDFCQDYWSAAALLHGQAVYPSLHCWSGYIHLPITIEYNPHPPTSILLYVPFGLFSKATATMLWGLLSLAAYLMSGWLLLRSLHWQVLRGLALFVAASFLWPPAVQATQVLNMGQILLLLLVSIWLLEQRHKDTWAGVLLGVACLLKIWPLVILVIPLLQRRWRLVAATGWVVLLGFLITLLVEGASAYLAYWGPIRSNEQDWVTFLGNVSVVGAVAGPLTGSQGVSFALPPLVPGVQRGLAVVLGEAIGAVLLGGGMLLLWWRRQVLDSETGKSLAFGFVVTLILLVFPLTWQWGIIILLLPITTLVMALRQLPRPPRWWWILLVASLLPFYSTNWLTVGVPQELLGYHQVGFVLLRIIAEACPTLGLLVFASAQAWLLAWRGDSQPRASEPQTSCDLTEGERESPVL